MEKIKKIAKYTTNILAIINALIVGLIPIWNLPNIWNLISKTIILIMAVIGTYLLGDKAIQVNAQDKKNQLLQDEIEEEEDICLDLDGEDNDKGDEEDGDNEESIN